MCVCVCVWVCVCVCVCARCSFRLFHTWQLSKEPHRIGSLHLLGISRCLCRVFKLTLFHRRGLNCSNCWWLVCTGFLYDNSAVPRNIMSRNRCLLYANHHTHSDYKMYFSWSTRNYFAKNKFSRLFGKKKSVCAHWDVWARLEIFHISFNTIHNAIWNNAF